MSAQSVNYDYDRDVDFSRYKTYKWVRIEGAQYPDQLTDQNIREAIDMQLAEKGLSQVEGDEADLYVGYQASVHEETEVTSYGTVGGWRFGGGTATTMTSTIEVGTLVLDIYDPAAKSLVWRGSATRTIAPSKDPEKDRQKLQRGAKKLLKHYPPNPD